MSNWKPEVLVDGSWGGNSLVFATEEEAIAWGKDRLMRWTVPTDSRAVPTNEPPNYKIDMETGVITRIQYEGKIKIQKG